MEPKGEMICASSPVGRMECMGVTDRVPKLAGKLVHSAVHMLYSHNKC